MTTPQGGVTRAVLAIAMAANYAFAQAPTPAPAADTTATQGEATAPPSGELTELPPITVSANDGIATPLDSTGVSVSVLDPAELRKEGVYTLSEALTRVPGVYVMPGGGLEGRGNTNKMVTRGMNSSQNTLPVLDGMRLFNASDIGNISPNLIGALNTFDLGGLEVLRGSQAAVYGGGNMGGVLYMTTPKGQGEPSYSLFTELGSFDSVTSNARAQGQLGKLSYFVSATYERTDNDLRYADGSPMPSADAGAYEAWNEALRLDYQVNDNNSISLTYRRSDSDFTNAFGGVYENQSNLITGTWKSVISSKYSTKLMLGYHGADLDLADYYSHYDNVQLDWSNDYKWNDQHSSSFGLSWNRNDGEVTGSAAYPGNADQKGLESVVGARLGHSFTPADNWENSVALRLDNSNIFDTHASFRAASNYRFNQERTRVFGSVSSGYVSPTSFERSNGSFTTSWGEVYQGNPDLDVSTSVSVDLGVEQNIADKHKVSATLFWSQIYDGIEKTEYPQIPTTFYNSDEVWTMQGVEIALKGTFNTQWETNYSLSWTLTQPKTGADKQIADTARQIWSADINTKPIEKLTVGMGLSGAVGRTDYNGNRIDNYAVLRAYANYQVNEQIQLHLRLENLTDEDYVTSPGGGWSPDILGTGIGLYGGFSISF